MRNNGFVILLSHDEGRDLKSLLNAWLKAYKDVDEDQQRSVSDMQGLVEKLINELK